MCHDQVNNGTTYQILSKQTYEQQEPRYQIDIQSLTQKRLTPFRNNNSLETSVDNLYLTFIDVRTVNCYLLFYVIFITC